MSSDNAHGDHDAPEIGHEAQPHAGDIIPENSPQDMVLKLLVIVGALLVCGTFGWWWTLPLTEVSEAPGAVEGVQH